MPKATRYPCSGCGNGFVLELFVQQDSQLCCLFCNSQANALAEVKELKNEVARLKDELQEVRKLVQAGKAVATEGEQEQSRTDDTTLADDGFQTVRNGSKANAQIVESATVTVQNRFAVLQEETEPEPDVILVGDSLVSGQGYEFCRGKPNRKHRCYPGRKIEDITERVDHLVENTTEDTLFVTVVGTNNLHRESATDIVEKYRDLMKEFADRRRKAAVCGIIPRYDVGPAMFWKMSVINRGLSALCRQEDMYYFDLWHHFCLDKTLYSRDGLHLNCVGKARLGRVLGEAIADIPRPPKVGKGSTDQDDINSVASAEEVASVTDNDHTTPEENEVPEVDNEVPEVDRQDEAGEPSAVPVTDVQTAQEDFH